jgi:hypothetical protein
MSDIQIKTHNETRLLVVGERKKHTKYINSLGGRWNNRVKDGPGWLVPIKHKQSILKYKQEMSMKDQTTENLEEIPVLCDSPGVKITQTISEFIAEQRGQEIDEEQEIEEYTDNEEYLDGDQDIQEDVQEQTDEEQDIQEQDIQEQDIQEQTDEEQDIQEQTDEQEYTQEQTDEEQEYTQEQTDEEQEYTQEQTDEEQDVQDFDYTQEQTDDVDIFDVVPVIREKISEHIQNEQTEIPEYSSAKSHEIQKKSESNLKQNRAKKELIKQLQTEKRLKKTHHSENIPSVVDQLKQEQILMREYIEKLEKQNKKLSKNMKRLNYNFHILIRKFKSLEREFFDHE